MISEQSQRAPGPAGHWLLGNLPEFRRDVLSLLTHSTKTFGDVVRLRLGPHVIHLLNHPDHLTQVLQTDAARFDKNTRSAKLIQAVTGDSLLTTNGEMWKRQRQLLQPAFHHRSIEGFAEIMTTSANSMLLRWKESEVAGRPLDLANEMMRLTYTIVGRTLFSVESGRDSETIEKAMNVILPETFEKLGRIVDWPDWIPTLRNRKYRDSLRSLDRVVYRIIEEHRLGRTNNPMGGDLLSILLQVRDPDTHEGLTDLQLRNETLTLLLAGHETTANALMWTFYLLCEYPEVEARLRDEVTSVLNGRIPTTADLSGLKLNKMVIKEAMRLYPPIWIIERRVISDTTVGRFHLAAGSSVVMAPYALHRHPAFWEAPEEFRPERFSLGNPEAYFPFGAGPRFCIGREFAMLEAQLILAMVVQAFRFQRLPNPPVIPLPGITLRSRHGLMVKLGRHNRN